MGGTETIVVVEDDPEIRKFIQIVMHKTGYTVPVASHAEEALTLSERHPGTIHLLLTDLIRPGMSGCDLPKCG